jgi:hypothetical protein
MLYALYIGYLYVWSNHSLSLSVDHRRLAGVRRVQIRQLASWRRRRAARRLDRYLFIHCHGEPRRSHAGHPTAGKDATKAFFGLHRQEVLYRPQYARLQVGTIKGKEPQITPLAADALSQVPYAEPSWLAPGFSSPYYNESHRRFQRAMRKLVNEVVLPDAIACEDNGRRISQQVVDKLGYVRRRTMTHILLQRDVLTRGPCAGKQI